MEITGERYQVRALLTFPHGLDPSRDIIWNTATVNLGDAPPTPDDVPGIRQQFNELQARLAQPLTVQEPVIRHQERHTRRLLGLELSTWHVVDVVSLPETTSTEL